MVGILYRDRNVYLVGDKKTTTSAETFEIMTSLVDLFSKVVSKSFKSKKAAEDFLKRYKVIMLKAYLEVMGNRPIGEFLTDIEDHIEDNQMGFELKPKDHFKAYIAATPKSNISLLCTIIYCIIIMLTELIGNIDYVMKGPDLVDHFMYIDPESF